MAFEIVWSDSADRRPPDLRKGGRPPGGPAPHVRKRVNSPYHRLRVGDYRVILDIHQGALRILVLKVGPRESIYER